MISWFVPGCQRWLLVIELKLPQDILCKVMMNLVFNRKIPRIMIVEIYIRCVRFVS